MLCTGVESKTFPWAGWSLRVGALLFRLPAPVSLEMEPPARPGQQLRVGTHQPSLLGVTSFGDMLLGAERVELQTRTKINSTTTKTTTKLVVTRQGRT